MSDTPQKIDMYFMQLVLSLQAGAMQQLGKVMSPITGKIERDLVMARHTIDILGMLQAKTEGNLTEEESKFIGHVLYELRLNFVDESKKGDGPAEEDAKADKPAEETPGAGQDATDQDAEPEK